jgi:hypothetical protein
MNPISAYLLWWKGETEVEIVKHHLDEFSEPFYKGLKIITALLALAGISWIYKNFK